jgi:competence protein ComEC
MLLPTLPGMLCIGIVFCLACLLCFLPHKYIRSAGLTLLFFLWGILAAKEALWAGNTLPAKTQQAIVRITGTDNMTTHYGQITHLQGNESFLHKESSCTDSIYPVMFVRVRHGR